jgi:cell division protein FtsB
MAGGGGERRMVFDTSGKRKHVVKFVYAILAILMGSSLFLVVGPVNIGGLLGNSSSTSSSAVFEEQAANLERKLKKSPTDEDLLAALFRTRVNAANASIVVNPTTQRQEVPAESITQFQRAAEVWDRYLKQAGGEPNPGLAQLAANSFFATAANSPVSNKSFVTLEEASDAQQIVAKARPSLNSLSTLAIYQYFSLNFAAGDKSKQQAEALTKTKAEAKAVTKQLAEYRKRAKKLTTVKKELEKAQQGTGKQALENPLGGIGGTESGLSQ